MYVESNCLSYLLPWWNGKNKRCVCGWVTERAQTLGCETQHQPRWVELRRAGSLLQRSEIFFFVAALWPEPGFTWSKWVLISMTRGLCKVKFYFCNLKSQSYSLSGLYSLYRERHPLSLHPQFEKGSLPRKKKPKRKKLQEEPPDRDPSLDGQTCSRCWTYSSDQLDQYMAEASPSGAWAQR